MDTSLDMQSLIIASLIAVAVTLWILHSIISSASRSRKMWAKARKQTKILSAIAKQQGVHDDTLKEILEESQYQN